jgi:hypothetical protein
VGAAHPGAGGTADDHPDRDADDNRDNHADRDPDHDANSTDGDDAHDADRDTHHDTDHHATGGAGRPVGTGADLAGSAPELARVEALDRTAYTGVP